LNYERWKNEGDFCWNSFINCHLNSCY
jgi:hypothetical protein